MFYVFWMGWVDLAKSAESKGFSANATQKAEKGRHIPIFRRTLEQLYIFL
jgi:hypothetical protein